MRSFIAILALAASFTQVSFAAPTAVGHSIAKRCDCNVNNVPSAIALLSDVATKVDADIRVKAQVDLHANVQASADIIASLDVLVDAVNNCAGSMTGYRRSGVDLAATVQVFADVFVKVDALLAVCTTLDVDIDAKAQIYALVSSIRKECGVLVAVLARVFIGIKALVSLKVGLLVVLQSCF